MAKEVPQSQSPSINEIFKLQTYYATKYARSGVNQMWILKNSKELLANLKDKTSLK
jgi:hypothetical protein